MAWKLKGSYVETLLVRVDVPGDRRHPEDRPVDVRVRLGCLNR
jgi:hypothetical protein